MVLDWKALLLDSVSFWIEFDLSVLNVCEIYFKKNVFYDLLSFEFAGYILMLIKVPPTNSVPLIKPPRGDFYQLKSFDIVSAGDEKMERFVELFVEPNFISDIYTILTH